MDAMRILLLTFLCGSSHAPCPFREKKVHGEREPWTSVAVSTLRTLSARKGATHGAVHVEIILPVRQGHVADAESVEDAQGAAAIPNLVQALCAHETGAFAALEDAHNVL